MNTPELIQMQLTLECIGLDKDRLLVRIPGPNPDEIARVYVFYGADEYYVFFRHDLDPSIREQISKLSPENIFPALPSSIMLELLSDVNQMWSSGDEIVYREVTHGQVWTARPVVVIQNTPDLIALYLRHNTHPLESLYSTCR